MRSVFRAMDPSDLEAARLVVSRAEQESLARAEELCREAEVLFASASVGRSELERQVRDEVLAAVKGDLVRAREQSEHIVRRAESDRRRELEALQTARAEAEREMAQGWAELETCRNQLEAARAEVEAARDQLRDQVSRMRGAISLAWGSIDGLLAAEITDPDGAPGPEVADAGSVYEVDLREPVSV